jgi:hypothetical protein
MLYSCDIFRYSKRLKVVRPIAGGYHGDSVNSIWLPKLGRPIPPMESVSITFSTLLSQVVIGYQIHGISVTMNGTST